MFYILCYTLKVCVDYIFVCHGRTEEQRTFRMLNKSLERVQAFQSICVRSQGRQDG